MSSLHMLPANQDLWGTSMNSRMWEQQYTSAKTMRNSSAPFRTWKCGELRRFSKRCKRRLAFSNIVIMKSTDLKKQWIGQVVIGEFFRCWIKRLPRNSHHKSKYSVIRFCVLAENVKNILRKQKLGKTIAPESASNAQNISHITISQVLPWNQCGRFTWERRPVRFSNASKNDGGKRNKTSTISRQDLTTTSEYEQNNRNESWNSAARVDQYARDFKPGQW